MADDPTATERKRRERERKAAGLKRLELWAPAHHHKPIRQYAEKLREEDDDNGPTNSTGDAPEGSQPDRGING